MVKTSRGRLNECQPAFSDHVLPWNRYLGMPYEDIRIEDSFGNRLLRGLDQTCVWCCILNPLAVPHLGWKTVDKVCHFIKRDPLSEIPIFEQQQPNQGCRNAINGRVNKDARDNRPRDTHLCIDGCFHREMAKIGDHR